MKLASECMSCLIKQVERAIRLLQPNAPNSLIVETQHRVMQYIASREPLSLRSEDMGTITYKIIGEALEMEDPYSEQKKKYNKLALEIYPRVFEYTMKSQDSLKFAITLSILGNSIDFGASSVINFDNFADLSNVELGEPNHYDRLIMTLENAKSILILGDNTGEIVFDKILVKTLTEYYPDKTIIYSVRGGPIINDATLEDAIEVGMTLECKVLESSLSPGVILKECPAEFQSIFNKANLIISKGQGNFESIITTPTPEKSVFFLLKAKCELISRVFEVPQGTLLLREKTNQLISKIEE